MLALQLGTPIYLNFGGLYLVLIEDEDIKDPDNKRTIQQCNIKCDMLFSIEFLFYLCLPS